MSGIDFAKRMAHVPNEELFAVVSGDGFMPAAVEAAKREIERRNLAPDAIQGFKASVDEQRHAESAKPDLPLGWGGRIAFILFGVAFVWSLFAAYRLRALGYRRKSNQALVCVPASFALWGIVALSLTSLG